ncbi:helix-turn-helix transcriptional regulator [uncultured Bosea sp.]|uniref:ArsR/SmtB family transcription factor n=1 Tax=uncultured Bosea sp. TaxID=211457 RepID=UPI0025FB1056|nr:metalloregulator ArsR/SmtB family transcription factor [uncultured Bosea sp.]
MEISSAVTSLAALAHAGRLTVFRMLVQAGPEGLAAGVIAQRLSVPPSSLSANLNLLSNAGLIVSRREGRSIVYTARYDEMARLLGYLLDDCCDGSPEICRPLAERLSQAVHCFDSSNSASS